MDMQLEDLVQRIRREGLEAADAEKSRIMAEAEALRSGTVAEAKKEAASILEEARYKAAQAEESGRAALAQASRDFLLAFRGQLEALLGVALAERTKEAFGPEAMAEAIVAAVKGLSASSGEELSVLVPASLLSRMEAAVPGMLAAELRKRVSLAASAELESGFRVVEKGGAAYFDFSAAALAELFATRLNARLAETLRNAAKGL